MVKATHQTKDEFHETRVPGAFYVCEEVDSDGEQSFWYRCPCGCAVAGLLTVGKNFKPDSSPSWCWNGSFDLASLIPSVHHVGHWHGYLTNGAWTSV